MVQLGRIGLLLQLVSFVLLFPTIIEATTRLTFIDGLFQRISVTVAKRSLALGELGRKWMAKISDDPPVRPLNVASLRPIQVRVARRYFISHGGVLLLWLLLVILLLPRLPLWALGLFFVAATPVPTVLFNTMDRLFSGEGWRRSDVMRLYVHEERVFLFAALAGTATASPLLGIFLWQAIPPWGKVVLTLLWIEAVLWGLNYSQFKSAPHGIGRMVQATRDSAEHHRSMARRFRFLPVALITYPALFISPIGLVIAEFFDRRLKSTVLILGFITFAAGVALQFAATFG